MKKELLSPVGNMESLYQAIHNGADAVYLGGKKYGARMFSDNFTNEELINAINYCHLYGVKIYITINTIVFNDEISDFLQYVEFIYKNGVDAVIMQDIGMINLVRKKFPDLEIHASTQVHNYNNEGLSLLKEMGVSRVVLARELSLKEISQIKVDIEKEIFIHGALCVCFSGCCLFSSMTANRSGNRGECIASCRLPYHLYKNDKEIATEGKYLLSPKELSTIEHFKEIMDSDVTSLKIEGRMKSPEYVGFITNIYRTLIDKYYKGEELSVSNDVIDNLKTLFNREFTGGYLFNESGYNLMNIKSPNHIGINIGKVIDVNDRYIKIKLNRPLHQEDGIRFILEHKGMIVNKLYNEKMLLVNKIEKNEIAILDNKINLKSKSDVMLTTNSTLIKDISHYSEKKIELKVKVEAKIDKKISITVTDDKNNTITVYGSKVLLAINNPVTPDNIMKQISKLGNTPFIIASLDIESDDNIFISLKELNELRRQFVEEISSIRTSIKNRKVNNVDLITNNVPFCKKISILVRTLDQLLVAIENNIDYIYVTDFNLFKKYKHLPNIYYRSSRIIKNYQEFKNLNILACDLGAIYKYKNSNNVITDYYLNIVNDYSINFLQSLGVKRITISPEVKKITPFKSKVPLEMIIYGRIELMVSKYCPLNMLLNKENKKCDLCLNNDKYYLKDQLGNCFPIINTLHIIHIMHHKNIDLIKEINKYYEKGISVFRIELFDENRNDVEKIINKVRSML